jgi:long-chain acyl-CoA synthetase
VAFFTWNAQSFTGRWLRRVPMAFATLLLPLVYLVSPVFAMRVLHTFLRGVSRDRLDLLGEEYFEYSVMPRLRPEGADELRRLIEAQPRLVLASDSLDHIVRPLARHLGLARVLANRLEFRDGIATGRLLDPIIPPRGIVAGLFSRGGGDLIEPRAADSLARELRLSAEPEELLAAVVPSERVAAPHVHSVVRFAAIDRTEPLSVRKALAGKHILLIGATGFIGKVWLANLLTDLPEIGKVYLLIRRQKSTPALRRFEKIVEESPVFVGLHDRYGADLPSFIGTRVEVLDGDVTQPGLGLDSATAARLHRELDLIVNSAGLTDFNPDLRDALSINIDGVVNVTGFQRRTDHAALLHLSTCFTVGFRDGRIDEELRPNYTPRTVPGFDVEQERESLLKTVEQIIRQSESPEVTEDLRHEARRKGARLSASAQEGHVRKYRLRWVRDHMIEVGMRRARELGWPNTYCFSKSLGESLIAKLAGDLPYAIVRPSITETSTHQPFRGWNEGVNTSAPLSYLLGTYFRQLPSNERKCLDLIPVDLVARGMSLIAAALVERRHHRLYHLATSGCNPCDMRRSIELTCLAHRKFYRAQGSRQLWLKARFDTIAVSKDRYNKFSAPGQRAMVKALRRLTSPIPFAYSSLVRAERDLERLEKLIDLYEPFILHNEHAFEARNVELLSAVLPEEEQSTFGYDAHAIDWWEYWINLHVPALRRWTYPLIEGRPLEPLPRREFHLPVPAGTG